MNRKWPNLFRTEKSIIDYFHGKEIFLEHTHGGIDL